MSDTTEPVKVNLTVTDWQKVPMRSYRKTIQIDREDWNDWSRQAREREIATELEQFYRETFEREYEIENASLDDPTAA